jgi:hypothetical protein
MKLREFSSSSVNFLGSTGKRFANCFAVLMFREPFDFFA